MANWDELMTSGVIQEARLWFERANTADPAMKAFALAVWAQWYGGSLVQHAEATDLRDEWEREAGEARDGK
jgi:hypothetical protein